MEGGHEIDGALEHPEVVTRGVHRQDLAGMGLLRTPGAGFPLVRLASWQLPPDFRARMLLKADQGRWRLVQLHREPGVDSERVAAVHSKFPQARLLSNGARQVGMSRQIRSIMDAAIGTIWILPCAYSGICGLTTPWLFQSCTLTRILTSLPPMICQQMWNDYWESPCRQWV